MRWKEISEEQSQAQSAERERKKLQQNQVSQIKANDQLSRARAASADALRVCQKRQQKARENGDSAAAADALRKFEKSRSQAQSQATSAQAKLRK